MNFSMPLVIAFLVFWCQQKSDFAPEQLAIAERVSVPQYVLSPNGLLKKVFDRDQYKFRGPESLYFLSDSQLVDALDVDRETQKKLNSKIRVLTKQGDELWKKQRSNPDNTEQVVLSEKWKKATEQAEQEIDRILKSHGRATVKYRALEKSFFVNGPTKFIESRLTLRQSEEPNSRHVKTIIRKIDIEKAKNEILVGLREIEKDVLSILMKGIDPEKSAFVAAMLDGVIPDRVPMLSVLWQSMREIEKSVKPQGRENGKLPYFQVSQAGFLIRNGEYRSNEVNEIVELFASMHSDVDPADPLKAEASAMIRLAFDEVMAIDQQTRNKENDLRASMEGDQFKQAREKIREESDIQKRKVVEDLQLQASPEFRENFRLGSLLADYQRFGLFVALFQEEHGKNFPVKFEKADLNIIKSNVPAAKSTLSKRLNELVLKTFEPMLLKYFTDGDDEVRWLHGDLKNAIPPVELVFLWKE